MSDSIANASQWFLLYKDQDVVFSIAKSCNGKLVENTVYSTPAGAAATHQPGHRLGEDR